MALDLPASNTFQEPAPSLISVWPQSHTPFGNLTNGRSATVSFKSQSLSNGQGNSSESISNGKDPKVTDSSQLNAPKDTKRSRSPFKAPGSNPSETSKHFELIGPNKDPKRVASNADATGCSQSTSSTTDPLPKYRMSEDGNILVPWNTYDEPTDHVMGLHRTDLMSAAAPQTFSTSQEEPDSNSNAPTSVISNSAKAAKRPRLDADSPRSNPEAPCSSRFNPGAPGTSRSTVAALERPCSSRWNPEVSSSSSAPETSRPAEGRPASTRSNPEMPSSSRYNPDASGSSRSTPSDAIRSHSNPGPFTSPSSSLNPGISRTSHSNSNTPTSFQTNCDSSGTSESSSTAPSPYPEQNVMTATYFNTLVFVGVARKTCDHMIDGLLNAADL
ncbi:hypothetical protein L596_001727 [Steinernema carpocapsae]|uniref:Uncharacterized protein n=1 Tax=Steinernema carpocapsae TaxID=34508 RepID=A0A4V6YSU1_STECR|nr:hypothetical protein L596_001727 [Steinernema carpocapsae]